MMNVVKKYFHQSGKAVGKKRETTGKEARKKREKTEK
jgi:hypothetical protein